MVARLVGLAGLAGLVAGGWGRRGWAGAGWPGWGAASARAGSAAATPAPDVFRFTAVFLKCVCSWVPGGSTGGCWTFLLGGGCQDCGGVGGRGCHVRHLL